MDHDEPTETSPIRNDFRLKSPQNSGATSFTPFDQSADAESHPDTISYATWSARTWSGWNKATRFLVLILGVTLILVAIVLIASISTSSSSESDGVLRDESQDFLEIPQGRLKWSTLTSRGGREYYAFYKVPYAMPPINGLRFELPQPPEKWKGTRFEKEVAPQCLQKAKYSPIIEAVGEEDCLYMNIYSPKLPGIELEADAHLLPTLFYIHGGGFSDGNGSRYGGKYFMDEDAVMITFQYRLGIFGFLSSEDGIIRGNMGMQDQVQGLKWVKENIRYFGGDPDRVMIYGNSAGGMSVNQLMVSPLAAALFHRAITQSGPTFNAILKPKEDQLKSYEALATTAGCWPDSVDNIQDRNRQVLNCLRDKNASDLAVIRGPDVIFATTVETYQEEDESHKFMPETMYNLYKTGNINKVPWLIGVVNSEWIGVASGNLKDPEMVHNLNANWTGYAPTMFMSSLADSPIRDSISTKSREFYFGTNPISNDTLRNLSNILSDRDIIHGSHTQGTLMSEFGVDVFFYYMSKRPIKSYSDKGLAGYPPGDYGASHADELQYLFDYYGYPEYLEGSEYYEFSKEMVRIWVQFAATAKPGWDPISKDQTAQWYELNDRMGPTPVLHERMQFWDQFTPEELCFT